MSRPPTLSCVLPRSKSREWRAVARWAQRWTAGGPPKPSGSAFGRFVVTSCSSHERRGAAGGDGMRWRARRISAHLLSAERPWRMGSSQQRSAQRAARSGRRSSSGAASPPRASAPAPCLPLHVTYVPPPPCPPAGHRQIKANQTGKFPSSVKIVFLVQPTFEQAQLRPKKVRLR